MERGRRPAFPSFNQKYGLKGGMISAVDLLNGIARCAAWRSHRPRRHRIFRHGLHGKGAVCPQRDQTPLTLSTSTSKAPDEAGHAGSTRGEGTGEIENVDRVVGAIQKEFNGIVAVLPDHPTPIRTKTHSRDPVPFVVTGKGTDKLTRFSEKEARSGMFGTKGATDFLSFLFN